MSALKGRALGFVGIVLALGNFIVVLDMTVANVAVNTISGALAVSPSQGTWVITSYSVAEAITVPLTGWLAGRFGTVRTFVAAEILFGIASLMSGLSTSLGMLVALRVTQGLAGGPIMPLTQTLLLRIFPPERAGAATGIWAMTTLLAPIAGPLLGGIICDNYHWGWIFLINVPVIAISAPLAWSMLRSQESERVRQPIDYVGLALLMIFVGSLQIMLDKGQELDWFSSDFIVGLALTASIGFIAFLIWELTEAQPIVDLRVFRHRGFTTGAVTMSLVFGAFFSTIVLLPLWLQTNLGYTATWAGRSLAAQGLLALTMAPIVARYVTKWDARPMVSFGLTVLGVVSVWRASFTTGHAFFDLTLPQFVQGIGMPFFFMPLMTLALSSVLPQETASAAGLLNFLRTTAGAVATSITTTVWTDGASRMKTELVGRLNDPQATLSLMTQNGLPSNQALGQLDALVNIQAVMLSTDRLFLIGALICLAAAAGVWLAPKPSRQADLSAAH